MADVKRIVEHNKLYMRVNGETVHLEKGSEVTMTEEQAKRLGKKVSEPKAKKSAKADAGKAKK